MSSAKFSSINPLIKVTHGATKPRGDEVDTTLMNNPYQGQDAAQYENGWEYAQQLGHQNIGGMLPEQAAKWKTRPAAWRKGFADAAGSFGQSRIGNVVSASKWSCLKTAFVPVTVAGGLGGLVGGIAQDNVIKQETTTKAESEAVRGDPLGNLPLSIASGLIPVGAALAGGALGYRYAGPATEFLRHHLPASLHSLGHTVLQHASPEEVMAGVGSVGGSLAAMPATYYLNWHVALKRLEKERNR